MKMVQVQELAKNRGLKPGRLKKADLIHAMQCEEGNRPCFNEVGLACEQADCLWRDDCSAAKL
ncbi:MAG: SAP domain-containing protein [Negativicutes bacterium]|nr:SAP domain-containing protein [Negativicutes bacterium]